MKIKTIIRFLQLLLLTESFIDAMEIRRSSSIQQNVNCYCGESNSLSTRIVGGRRTKPDHIPWQALITNDNIQHCGGSVISDRYIITAGHCLNGYQISRLSVILGVYNSSKLYGGTQIHYKVIKGILHPKFASHEQHDLRDIALLKVDKQIKYNHHIKSVCLTNKGASFDGKLVSISGWGKKSSEGATSEILLEANVRVLTDKECLKTKLGDHFAEDVESMFCAYGKHKDACQGDSGGPLVYKSPKGVMILIGLISWGEQCGLIDYPGVYTRLSSFHDWIYKNTKDSTYCIPKHKY